MSWAAVFADNQTVRGLTAPASHWSRKNEFSMPRGLRDTTSRALYAAMAPYVAGTTSKVSI